jgi:hypothetical protein
MANPARKTIWREALFDREAEFRVFRPIRLNGENLQPGSLFDKSLVSTRTLRCLYDNGQLEMVATAAATAPGVVGTDGPELVHPPRGDRIVRHIGRGRFAVMEGDKRLTDEPLSREDADAALARMRETA